MYHYNMHTKYNILHLYQDRLKLLHKTEQRQKDDAHNDPTFTPDTLCTELEGLMNASFSEVGVSTTKTRGLCNEQKTDLVNRSCNKNSLL